MPRRRKHIPLTERLASALSLLLPQAVRDDLREQKVSAKKVIGLFDTDHNILHALDGADRWWNLTPMLRPEHREKARKDTSIVAKVRRIDKKWNEFTALGPKPKKPKRKWPSRPFPTGADTRWRVK